MISWPMVIIHVLKCAFSLCTLILFILFLPPHVSIFISLYIFVNLWVGNGCYHVVHRRKDGLDEGIMNAFVYSICFLYVSCASFHVLNIVFSFFCSRSSKIKIVIIVIDSNLYWNKRIWKHSYWDTWLFFQTKFFIL
jgi:hypothetical protein